MNATENLPDIRSLLYWDPEIAIGAGKNHEIVVTASSTPGKYTVVLEGVTSSGQPLYHISEFRVE